MIKSCLVVLLVNIFFVFAYGQQATLDVSFSKSVVNWGDTIDIDFTLKSPSAIHNKATINCIIKSNAGFERKLRWPLISKNGVVQLISDKNLPNGIYDFIFYLQEGIFHLQGTVVSPEKINLLKAVLVNNKGKLNLEEVKVGANRNFVFKNYIFENFATLIFSEKNGKQNRLDIQINSLLDSTYNPIATVGARINVGSVNTTNFSPLLKLTQSDSLFYKNGQYLQEVIVYSKTKTVEERYNENYVGGLFQDLEAKSYSPIDDPQAQSSTDVLQYIQNKFPNIRIIYNQNGEAIVKMRNMTVQFYLDEIPLDVTYIQSISISDIGMVKFFNPPFIGNPGGQGGAMAIYTRRGGDIISKSTGNCRFRVKGYTPALTTLSIKE